MHERVGKIKAHYWSGKIEVVSDELLESHAPFVIATLPPLAEGSFYAFHAERLARPYDVSGRDRLTFEEAAELVGYTTARLLKKLSRKTNPLPKFNGTFDKTEFENWCEREWRLQEGRKHAPL
jgi:hypothetical protein